LLANDGPSPNTRVQARFWIGRLNNEQDAVGRGFVEMVKEQAIPAVVDVLSGSTPDDRRKVLQQIVQTPSPEKVVGLEKVFKTTTVQPFRTQIVESTATMPESAAREFLTDVANNETDYIVRVTAIHALAGRTDVNVKTLADILDNLKKLPVRTPAPPVRVKKE
jgi:HEAT repeat protein